MTVQQRLLDVPLAGVYPIDVAEANEFIALWGHDLGPVNRPFRQEGYALEVAGHVVSVSTSGSIVNGPVAGYDRDQVVELTRLCSAPGASFYTRVMLRLWRETCARTWPLWPIAAAVSYSENAKHRGHIYRDDGWRKVREDAGAGKTPSVWGRRRDGEPYSAAGPKTLWCWEYAS